MSLQSGSSSGLISSAATESISAASLAPDPENNTASRSAVSGRNLSAQVTSASELASVRGDFHIWASMVHLNQPIGSVTSSNPAFEQILKIQGASKKYPGWLALKGSPQFTYIAKGCVPIKDTLCADLLHIKALQPERFHDNPDPDMSAAIPHIFQTTRHNRLLNEDYEKVTEMDIRNTIDALIEHLTEGDDPVKVKYRTKRELKLPEVQFKNYGVPSLQLDGIIYVEVQDFQPYVASDEFQQAASAFKAPSKHLKMALCVFGFNGEGIGENQASMAIVSGLYQKIALGVPEQLVFGVFTDKQSDFVRLVAGAWAANMSKMEIYNIGKFALNDPLQVVQLYLALREIVKLESSYVDQLRASEVAMRFKVTENPPNTKWTPPWLERIRGNSTEPNNSTQHAAGPNVPQGLAAMLSNPAQSEACDKILSDLDSMDFDL